jgi:hypothetical protein
MDVRILTEYVIDEGFCRGYAQVTATRKLILYVRDFVIRLQKVEQ